jgi:hypothetical protein
MLRSLALLAASAAAATGLLSGCGAGQITGTDSQVAPVPGLNLQSSDGSILVRDLKIAYRDPAGYIQGGTAPVSVLIYNTTRSPVILTGVQAQGGRVVLSGPNAVPPGGTSAAPLPPTTSSAPSASASPSRRPNGSASPSASVVAPSAPPSTVTPPPVGISDIRITIPPGGFVKLTPDAARYLQVTDLARALRSGGGVQMRFAFDNGAVIEANVPVGTPLTPLPRSPMDLHEEDEGGPGTGH